MLKKKSFYISLVVGLFALFGISYIYSDIKVDKNPEAPIDINEIAQNEQVNDNEVAYNDEEQLLQEGQIEYDVDEDLYADVMEANKEKEEKDNNVKEDDNNNQETKEKVTKEEETDKDIKNSNTTSENEEKEDIDKKQDEDEEKEDTNKKQDEKKEDTSINDENLVTGQEIQEENSVDVMSNTTDKTIIFNEEDGLLWPISGNVILNYSMDKAIYFKTLDQYKCNPAIIIEGTVDTQVCSAYDAKVTSIENSSQTGTTITTDIGNGYKLIYGQLKNVLVNVGDTIKEGDVIASIDEPKGQYVLEGSNLYFQVLENDEPVNPLLLLR